MNRALALFILLTFFLFVSLIMASIDAYHFGKILIFSLALYFLYLSLMIWRHEK